jgi:hypothetical protein
MNPEQRRSSKWTNVNVWMKIQKKLFGKGTWTDQYMAFVGRSPELVEIDLYLRQDLDLEGDLRIQLAVSDTTSDPKHPSLDKFVGLR